MAEELVTDNSNWISSEFVIFHIWKIFKEALMFESYEWEKSKNCFILSLFLLIIIQAKKLFFVILFNCYVGYHMFIAFICIESKDILKYLTLYNNIIKIFMK